MPTPITDYILQFPADVQQKLNELRTARLEIVPNATEKIAYGIPTFYVSGNLVHFAAYKHHIGFYPASSGIDAFREELAPYKLSRGTVQFPLDKPLPMELIQRIVKYRLAENLAK